MIETTLPELSAWESFYVIVGSSGAALTGLQFVVMTLVSELRRRTGGAELDTFASPTVVHFTVTLVVAAVLSAPWPTVHGPAIALALIGAGGVVYSTIVTRRARRTTQYVPVLEDWIWHVVLPFIAYGTLLVAALFFTRVERDALFAIAAVALLLLVIGIHNSWDTVTFITLQQVQEAAAEQAAAADSLASSAGSSHR